MQKRVALMQTLATEPRILLLDEPFAALDAQTRLVIEDEVVKVCRAERRTMLMVTHDIAEAISMADRIVVLTKRPASVKTVFETPLSRKAASVAEVPSMPEFTGFFRRIWESLEVSIPVREEAAP
jgi:NitT/TauT family transport system ATP-binding protein